MGYSARFDMYLVNTGSPIKFTVAEFSYAPACILTTRDFDQIVEQIQQIYHSIITEQVLEVKFLDARFKVLLKAKHVPTSVDSYVLSQQAPVIGSLIAFLASPFGSN